MAQRCNRLHLPGAGVVFVLVFFSLVVSDTLLRKLTRTIDVSFSRHLENKIHVLGPAKSNTTSFDLTNGTKYDKCRLLILSRGFDYHNEVLESIARQYPLDWESIMTGSCHEVGLAPEAPIQVDFFMGRAQSNFNNNTESYGWIATYFWPHLQGKVVQRTDDGRWIRFGSILDHDEGASQAIDWQLYRMQIENNCDRIPFKKWLNKNPNHRCVFHGDKLSDKTYEKRSCHLNPQWSPWCWFIPWSFTDLPPPTPPSFEGKTRHPLKICVASKYAAGVWYRNYTLLIRALQDLQPDPEMVHIIFNGRMSRIPTQIKTANLDHYFHIPADFPSSDFYQHQSAASKCHAMVPLIHPNDDMTKGYFKSAQNSGGILSGMVSQIIGMKVPSILQSSFHAIYEEYLTAPSFVYNEENFTDAFRSMLQHFNYPLTTSPRLNEEAVKGMSSSLITKKIHFVYVPVNEDCPTCPDGIDIHDLVSKKDPPKLYANILDIIKHYQSHWRSPPMVLYSGAKECHDAITKVKPELLEHYRMEKYGPHRSDICRLAQLYLNGGYYMDNDTKILKPFVVEGKITFSTVIGISNIHFSQGFIAATPQHPILKIALDLTLQHYQGFHMRNGIDYSSDTGTKILYDAYHEAIAHNAALKDETLLLQEKILKKTRYMEQVPFPVKRSINYCTAGFLFNNEVYMLARAPGTSYC